MGVNVLLLILLSVLAYSHGNIDTKRKWSDFKIKYMKNYHTPLEETRRFSIFKENLERFESHNQNYKLGKELYAKGVNQFADWTQKEFMEYLGLNNGLRERRTSVDFHNRSENFVLPPSVDWREKNVVTPVKNQGILASPWVYSVTGSIESQLALVKNELISLSEKNLVDCSENSSRDAAFEYVRKNGIESEKSYPNSSNGTCKADPHKVVTHISKYVNIPEGRGDILLEALATRGPISVAIDVTSDLMNYSSGIFNGNCSSISVNHAVLAVGYGNANGVNFYILKNSWGVYWGENGYFRLLRNGCNECGIATAAAYPII